MAFAGLKKQINKANQYVTEKMGGAEGTKLDMDFMEMERKTDVTVELVEELQAKTKEYLQPNPTARAKMAAVKGISKLSGQAKTNTYPQPEGILAECMLTYGKKLGEDSIFAQALIEFGESLKQMADVKYSLDDNIKQNVLEPLHHLQTKDLKEVMHHRKKLQGRRLDFDCKRRRQAKDDEIRSAEDKFAESLHLAQMGMYNLLENDVEQVSQLVTFCEALCDYHSQCSEVLKVLTETLHQKREEAEGRPKLEFTPKTLQDLSIDAGPSGIGTDGGANRYGGIKANGNGISGGGHTIIKNDRHYPPTRIKPNSTNSHHQLYSSQQNLSTSANNCNNNNLNNNNTDSRNSHFARNRAYGSYQSLTNARLTNNNNNSSTTATNTTTKSGASGSGSVDPSSFDWLNAWNNPPPSVPSASQGYTTKTTTMTTTTISRTSSSKQFSNFSSNTRPNAHFNDPWTVTKPTHLELDNGHAPARSVNASPLPSPMRSPAKTPATNRQPCCTALYDFEPENPGELGFKENDVIQLLNKVDENWYEGSVNGRTGYFPQSYVQILVPLPN